MARKVYPTFSDLPTALQNFFSSNVDDVYNGLMDDYKLPQDKFFEGIDGPILDSAMGTATLEAVLTKIGLFLKANISDEKQQIEAMVKLLKGIFWPLREIYGRELLSFLETEKIDYASWPQQRVLYKPISYAGAVSEVINRLNLHSSGQQARDRLRELLVSMIKGVRVPSQAKEVMLKPIDFGGLGFDEKMADQALMIIGDLIKSVQIMDENAYQDYIAAEIQNPKIEARSSKLEARSGRDSKFSEAEIRDSSEEDEQIANIKAKMEPLPKAVTELDKAIQATWERIPNKPEDEYLKNRLNNVISSRLRDVRNSIELLGLLQRDSKVGGMGLDKAGAESLAKIIEDAYNEFRGKIGVEEHGKLEVQLTEQRKKIEEKRKKDAEEHAKWYEEKIKKRQSADVERQELAQAIKKGFESREQHPLDLKSAAIEKKQYGELVAAPASVAKPPTVKVSAVTAAMVKEMKPITVDGVRPVSVPKLQGLVDELGGMTISSFRRLGKTPQDAVDKLLQRINTLGEEGFDQKASGIRAWQTSPVMKTYLDLVSQSFKAGKPIAQLAEDHRKAGEDTLTRDEIEVLINLNNSLHY
ncbi:MAG: hypothetical protein PHC53_04830 [Patescibacteria group bacterium]|nr:hypothetical protein [Patescibacteria group bacterium]